MRTSAGLDENFLAKQENSKPTIISLKDNETISSAWQNNQDPINYIQDTNNIEESDQNIDSNIEENIESENVSVDMPEENELEKNEEET
jgi:ArsR family metal-binding transcriptional regulator